MTGNHDTRTQQAQATTVAPKPGDRRAEADTGRETRIVKALHEARRQRHHRDCHCRRFDRQYCNAMDALWSRAMNRELGQMRTPKQ